MGLIVNVYRNSSGYDCTANGASSKVDSFTVVNVDGPFEPTPERPAMILQEGYVRGSVQLVPEALVNKRPMFGGNYAGTSDSRFSRAVGELLGVRMDIVGIFDRVEN